MFDLTQNAIRSQVSQTKMVGCRIWNTALAAPCGMDSQGERLGENKEGQN